MKDLFFFQQGKKDLSTKEYNDCDLMENSIEMTAKYHKGVK